MWAKIIAAVVEALARVGLARKRDADASKAKALEKSAESVGESLGVEKDIRDRQKDVDEDPSTAETRDGGLSFDKFNEGAE